MIRCSINRATSKIAQIEKGETKKEQHKAKILALEAKIEKFVNYLLFFFEFVFRNLFFFFHMY